MNNCDKCFKEMKDTDEVFEISNGDYVCQSCLEDLNNRYEQLKELYEYEGNEK